MKTYRRGVGIDDDQLIDRCADTAYQEDMKFSMNVLNYYYFNITINLPRNNFIAHPPITDELRERKK